MRYFLFVLLFVFSTHSFSGEIDGKGLDCKIGTSSQMFWFNQGTYEAVYYWEMAGAVNPANSLNYKKSKRYSTNHSTLTFGDGAVSYKLNRKTLELTIYNKLIDRQQVGSCKVFVGFDSVKKRQAELIKAIEKSKRENKI